MAAPDRPVLVVDDDAHVRAAVAITLEDEGYAGAGAEHGVAALAYLRTHPPPRLILLDWTMPVMDGRAFLAALAAEPELRVAPVVVWSADSRASDASVRIGAAGFLAKPTRLANLLQVVRAHAL